MHLQKTLEKYRQLRNRAVNQIRRDTLERIADRISQAKNEGETWRVVNDIIKPKSSNPITIKTADGEESTEEGVVAVNDSTRLQMAKSSFNMDAASVWNAAPGEIRSAKNIAEAKTLIRRFVKTLPV